MLQALDQLISACEDDLRQGRANHIPARLSALKWPEIPRAYRRPLANICRRGGLLTLGLKILSPVVRKDKRLHEGRPSPAELAEYAVLLQRGGMIVEALDILSAVSPLDVPDIPLYQAYCHFGRWDHESAIPLLKTYLLSVSDAPYKHLIGNVNLIAALVATARYDEALAIIPGTMAEAKETKSFRLLANCHELRAQIHLHEQNLSLARADLDAAEMVLDNEDTTDRLFVQKWRAVVESHSEKDVQKLLAFRERARARGAWEFTRDIDFHILKLQFHKDLFHRLYFGTPYSSYRQRMEREFSYCPAQSHYVLGATTQNPVDLCKGKGDIVHRLLSALLQDFYHPLTLGALFAALNPHEHFDIFSSPNRVHQTIFQARRWLTKRSIPAVISMDSNRYVLQVKESGSFLIPLQWPSLSLQTTKMTALKHAFPSGARFRAFEVLEKLEISPTSLKRLLKLATAQGEIKKVGKGSATWYKLAD